MSRRVLPRSRNKGAGVTMCAATVTLAGVLYQASSVVGRAYPFERVAEGRREVDAAVEVARLVEDGKRELEGERQARRQGARAPDVLEFADLVDVLEEGAEVVLAHVAEGGCLRRPRLRLHRRE
jgi:hypothetical protein